MPEPNEVGYVWRIADPKELAKDIKKRVNCIILIKGISPFNTNNKIIIQLDLATAKEVKNQLIKLLEE